MASCPWQRRDEHLEPRPETGMKKQKTRHVSVASPEGYLAVVAASGAWTGSDVFTVKLALCETPFHSTLAFRFEGDRLLLDSEHNVAFGSTKLPELIGQAAR